MDWLQLFFIVGSAAGLITLYWKIAGWFLNRPDIKLNTEIVYENEVPKTVKINVVNKGTKTIQIMRGGFQHTNKSVSSIEFTGLLPRWVSGGGGKQEVEMDFEFLRKYCRENEVKVKKAYVQRSDFKIYWDKKVPLILNELIYK